MHHIYKFDFSLNPLEKFSFGKNIQWGFKYFLYKKDKASGGIYDTQATIDDKDVGYELDTYLYWKITKNLYLPFRYGAFYPASAYPAEKNDNTKYFYSRMVATF